MAECEKKQERLQKTLRIHKEKALTFFTKTLYIRDFPDTWTLNDLNGVFEKFGKISSSKIDKVKAFVTFETAEEAKQAINELKGFKINDKKLYITLWQMKSDFTKKLFLTKYKRSLPKNVEKPEDDEKPEDAVGE